VRSDHIVWLVHPKSGAHDPDRLRRGTYRNPEDGQVLSFLTNNFALPAALIAQRHKCRWQVELFFQWIKQNLRIKPFFGASDKAVKTQVWIASCVYVLGAIVRRELRWALSPSPILQVLRVHPFAQSPLAELLPQTLTQDNLCDSRNQLMLYY
jgi:IS4 transposase